MMPVTGWTLFQSLVEQIQMPLMAAVAGMVGALTGPVGHIITIGLSASIAGAMLLAAIRGGTGNPLGDLEMRLIAGASIYLLCSSVANYNQWVSDLFLHTLSDEVSAVIAGGPPITGAAFDKIQSSAFIAGIQVYRNIGITEFALGMLVVLYWLVSFCAIAVGFAIWLSAQIVLALLVGLGPLLLATWPFPLVRSIAHRWVAGLIGASLTQIMTVALLSIITKAENTILGSILETGSVGMSNNISQVQLLLGGTALFAVCGIVLIQVPGIAASLTAGVFVQTGRIAQGGMAAMGAAGGFMGGAANSAGDAVGSAARAAGGTAGGSAGGRAFAGRSKSAG